MKVTVEISEGDLHHLRQWWLHDDDAAYDHVFEWFCHNVAPVVVATTEGETNGS